MNLFDYIKCSNDLEGANIGVLQSFVVVKTIDLELATNTLPHADIVNRIKARQQNMS